MFSLVLVSLPVFSFFNFSLTPLMRNDLSKDSGEARRVGALLVLEDGRAAQTWNDHSPYAWCWPPTVWTSTGRSASDSVLERPRSRIPTRRRR